MDEDRREALLRLLGFSLAVIIGLFALMWIAVTIGEYLTQDLDTRVMKNYLYSYEMCD